MRRKSGPWFLLALVSWFWTGGPALAQTVPVRSGEHGGFTRLVVDLPGGTGWQLGRTQGGYRLQIGGPALTYDVARVFERIPRTRLTALATRADGLDLALVPGTYAMATVEGGGRLIIDIHPGTPPKDSPFEAALTADPPGENAAGDPVAAASPLPHPASRTGPGGASGSATLSYRPEANSAASLPIYWRDLLGPGADRQPETGHAANGSADPPLRPASDPGETTGKPTGEPGTTGGESPPGTTSGTAGPEGPPTTAAAGVALPLDLPVPGFGARPLPLPSPALLTLEEELRQQVARAASQGLAEAAGTLPAAARPETPETDAGAAMADNPEEAEPAPDPIAEDHIAFHAETAMDRDSRDNPRAVPVTDDGRACPEESLIDLRHWGDARPAALQIAEARNGLSGEFDRPDPDAVLGLARLYLFLGMGAEARQTLLSFGLSSAETTFLPDMSYMLDGQPAPPASRFGPYAQCGTPAALWAFLSAPDAALPPAANIPAILRSFSGLPPHLRAALGPRLSNRLIAAGRLDAATSVRNAVARMSAETGRPLQMIEAEIALTTGAPEAQAMLADLSGGADDLAARALLLSIGERLRTGQPVPPADVEDLAALAFEARKGENAVPLARLEILARAASGDIAGAFDRLTGWTANAPASMAEDMVRALFAMLAEKADDEIFLAEYFARRALLTRAGADDALRLQLAGRLAGLGFDNEVHTLVIDPLAATDEGRLVLARSAERSFQPKEVLRLTEGLSGPEADALRASALDRTGDHRAAAALYAGRGQAEAAAAAAWRGGDPAGVAEDGRFRPLAAALGSGPAGEAASPPSAGDTAAASLAGSRSLLAESAVLRAALSGILAPTPDAAAITP